MHGGSIQPRRLAGLRQASGDGPLEFYATLAGFRMVAGTGLAGPEDATGVIADHRRGAGLPAINSQEKSHEPRL
jgi:hypothetical protein